MLVWRHDVDLSERGFLSGYLGKIAVARVHYDGVIPMYKEDKYAWCLLLPATERGNANSVVQAKILAENALIAWLENAGLTIVKETPCPNPKA